MGLDTTHDCWHGSYTSFCHWRNAVAVAAEYELTTVRYAGFEHESPKVVQDGSWADENYLGKWKRLPEDPLLVLLVHSDCAGAITPEAAPWLAKRLEQIAALLPDEENERTWRNYRETTLQFALGLRKAATAGEPVEFW